MPKLALDTTVNRIFKSYQERRGDPNTRKGKGFREHLGGSLIGTECARAVWYSFRWALPVKFPGRVLRLFETGDHEEPRLVDDLRRVGVTVFDHNPFVPPDPITGGRQQLRVSLIEGHFGGSLDAILQGIIEAPESWHLGEFKTASKKNFKATKKNGVRKEKPRYDAQMQTYMGAWNETLGEIKKLLKSGSPEDLDPLQSFMLSIGRLDRAFFIMKNKDNDDLLVERPAFEPDRYKAIKLRARRIIETNEPPEKLSESPAFYKCKWCDFSPVCHGSTLPSANCRTCAHSEAVTEPGKGGGWICKVDGYGVRIDADKQFEGCEKHIYLPPMIPFEATAADQESDGPNWVSYKLPDDRPLLNVTEKGLAMVDRQAATMYFEGPYSTPEAAEAAVDKRQVYGTSFDLAEKPIKMRDGRAVIEVDPC